jgi:glyoxylase-like metal-dependent hydrolase (beta-lactamase superfamily II)
MSDRPGLAEQPEEWVHPGAHPVVPGIYRIPLPLPNDALRAVNVYAVEADDRLTLIDAGWAFEESRRHLAQALEEIDRAPADIDRFLVTHVHRDHYTQAVAVRREHGTRIMLGIGERPTLEEINRPGSEVLGAQLEQLERAGAHPLADRVRAGRKSSYDTSIWQLPDEWLTGRTSLSLTGGRELMALPTPGHTRGHFVFADVAAGVMFAGDHVLPHITPSIGFETVASELPLRDYLQSLAVVRELPDMLLLPAHGPVTTSVHARVDELLAHHHDRLEACRAAVAEGAATAYDAAHVLGWTRRERRFDELDAFNQMLATIETGAHLDLLVAQGVLKRQTAGGVACYDL